MRPRLLIALSSAVLLSAVGLLLLRLGLAYPPLELYGKLTQALGLPAVFQLLHAVFGLGSQGKTLAFGGALLLWLGALGGLGLLRPLWAALGVAVLTLTLLPPGPALLYGGLYVLLRLGLERLFAVPLQAPERSRRQALLALGSGAAALASALTLRQGAGATVGGAEPLPRALPGEFTPVRDFYYVSKNLEAFDPNIRAEQWRLEVNGEVRTPLSLSLEQVRALPRRTVDLTLACISNPVGGPLIGHARWTGVPFEEVLKRAGVSREARYVIWHAHDGYRESLPLSEAATLELLLAYDQNGAALTPRHGFPLRVLIPGRYGMKQPRWLTRIEFSRVDVPGYWVERDWSRTAVVELTSRIDFPLETQPSVPAGQALRVRGIAFGGLKPITRVELSLDGGQTWQEARLERPRSRYAWTRWSLPWTPQAGVYDLQVRAFSGDLEQKREEKDALPEGATGYHHFLVNAS